MKYIRNAKLDNLQCKFVPGGRESHYKKTEDSAFKVLKGKKRSKIDMWKDTICQ